MNFKKLIFFFILFSFCQKDTLLNRATGDYFPLEKGKAYYYYSSLEDTIIFKFIGDTFFFGTSMFYCESNFEPIFFIKEKFRLQKFVCRESLVFGEIETLYKGLVTFLSFPLVEGEEWQDSIIQDTAKFYLTGKVLKRDTLRIPYGSFADVYSVMIKEKEIIGKNCDSLIYLYYLAPEVGIIKKEYDNQSEVLCRIE
uniref:Lipoprotein n=1 Tax=candidate division WOR-3 bacterium TaxID=2052148 RepID=A0A7V3ZVF4_UNCW3